MPTIGALIFAISVAGGAGVLVHGSTTPGVCGAGVGEVVAVGAGEGDADGDTSLIPASGVGASVGVCAAGGLGWALAPSVVAPGRSATTARVLARTVFP